MPSADLVKEGCPPGVLPSQQQRPAKVSGGQWCGWWPSPKHRGEAGGGDIAGTPGALQTVPDCESSSGRHNPGHWTE